MSRAGLSARDVACPNNSLHTLRATRYGWDCAACGASYQQHQVRLRSSRDPRQLSLEPSPQAELFV